MTERGHVTHPRQICMLLAEELDDEADRGEVTLREALYLDSIGKRREALGKLDAMLESGAAEGPLRVRLLSRRGMFLLSWQAAGSDGAHRL